MSDYSIGYAHARRLRLLVRAQGPPWWRHVAAIARLFAGHGTADDVRACAAIYARVGEADLAAELLRLVETRPQPAAHEGLS